MKKSEEKSQQSVGENLEAPVRLTPEQLEIVAAGFMARASTALRQISQLQGEGTVTTGAISPRTVFKML